VRVTVASTPQKTAALAARHVARKLRDGVGARGRATLALSGGTTASLLLAELARQPLDWSKLDVFQVDERVAPAGDAARNVVAIERALVSGKLLAPERLHAMPVGDADTAGAAQRYAEALAAVAGQPPVLDVVHLGLGTDGHTASLFPGDAVLEASAPVLVTAEQAGFRRMTLTLPVINAARHVVWLVTGAVKKAALERLATRGWDAPAGRVARRQAVIYADRAARAA
jgi:6-phosphogluconolactonase